MEIVTTLCLKLEIAELFGRFRFRGAKGEMSGNSLILHDRVEIHAVYWRQSGDLRGAVGAGGGHFGGICARRSVVFLRGRTRGSDFFAVDKRDGMGIIKIEHHRQRLWLGCFGIFWLIT